MNIKKIRYYQLFSTIFTFIFGTILHFTYEWSGDNLIVGLLSSVNESVWEHLKLLFFPMVTTTLIGCIYFKKQIPNLFCSKVFGIFIAMAFTVVFFYTYTGILGKNIAVIDITSFFIATILGELASYLLIVNKFKCNKTLSIIFLTVMLICFTFFTYNPPNIGLFKDSLLIQKKT